ncbi:MAG: translation elongation factor Ts [Halothiobacillus sp. 14-56-357]|jgi:elongation factor Ts|uniref:translation elongation factor Ts n=1 Tax=Halothiobacillus sp. 15-55-196 TaxID=1970382 RepID=UPI000BCBF66D|nr:translation elongation factor Ts [Halothiobacillus sp. 15-55-196]OZB36347.1 MAG: translation elongation factor Ts [Halothiobacillus sp. 15-55-196]OZB56112.1 MAG: translation elongation factor Ts [Halothiobacillus sp. 14-56-357]OZB76781.1 MAG: translation elongation factor Ts [Halothiobacillus sp. 13-55-115]
MTTISASLVKDLRERTGSGMMECKKALVETGGDIETAIEYMRKNGMAKADKKAGRVAAEGQIGVAVSDDGHIAAMVEVNSETDFVAKNPDFARFVQEVADHVLADNPADMDALMALQIDGQTIEEKRKALVAKLGENIQVRRFERFETTGVVGAYRHGERIGVLVELQGGEVALARDIAMHVAATRPVCVNESDVDSDLVAKEREIYIAQAADSGKPADIIEKMVDGRIRKFLAEVALVGQPFVKEPDLTVGKLLKNKGATCVRFARIEVGEGIEKDTTDFAAEVMAQVKGA